MVTSVRAGREALGLLRRTFDKFLLDPALNGVVTLLLLISFLATWRGLSDFISVQDGLASGGGFALLVGLVVLALTLAMYVALREAMRWRNWKALLPGLLAVALYAVLALWSVGFGYGFWWSLVAGEATSARELDAAITRLETDTAQLSARVTAAETVMDDAAALSAEKAAIEAASGGTCGLASGGGEGPLYRARMETNQTVARLFDSVSSQWAEPLRARLDALGATMGPADQGTGRATLERAFRDAAAEARTIASEAAARGRSYAALLEAKADQLDQAPVGGKVAYCHDPDLARALRLAAEALVVAEPVAPVKWQYSGGQAGVARSIETLWGSLFALRRPPMDGRSLIALVAAGAVDLALLAFTFFQATAAAARARDRRQATEGEAARALDEVRRRQDEAEAARRQALGELQALRDKARFDPDPEEIKWIHEKADELTAYLNRLRRLAIGDTANRELDDLQDKLDALIDGLRSLS
jgi:hypothetical protein